MTHDQPVATVQFAADAAKPPHRVINNHFCRWVARATFADGTVKDVEIVRGVNDGTYGQMIVRDFDERTGEAVGESYAIDLYGDRDDLPRATSLLLY